MTNFFSLPLELRNLILKQLTLPDLYHLISGKTSAIQLLHFMGLTFDSQKVIDDFRLADAPDTQKMIQKFLMIARFELFSRPGKKANEYKSDVLTSWLRHFNLENRLKFIENDDDKANVIELLGNTLKDPHSSLEIKLKCCFLINKLHPDPQDMTQKASRIFYGTEYFKYFPSELTTLTTDEFNSIIRKKITHLKEGAYWVLDDFCALSPFIINDTLKEGIYINLYRELDTHFNVRNFSSREAALSRCLNQLARYLSADRKSKLATKLMADLNDESMTIRKPSARALSIMAPHLFTTPEKINELLTVLNRSMNEGEDLVLHAVVKIFGGMIPFLNLDSGQKNTWFNTILKLLKERRTAAYIDVAIIQTLDAFVPYMSPENKKIWLAELRKRRSAVHIEIMEATTIALISLLPYTNHNEVGSAAVLDLLCNSAVKDGYSTWALDGLSKFAPYLSTDAEQTKVIDSLVQILRHVEVINRGNIGGHIFNLPISEKYSISYREHAAQTLGALAPYLSAPKINNLFELFLANLQSGSELVTQGAIHSLVALTPFLTTDEQKENMVTALTQAMPGSAQDTMKNLHHALSCLMPYVSDRLKDYLLQIFIPLVNDSQYGASATNALISVIDSLSSDKLKEIQQIPGESSFYTMSLQIIAQTLSHIDHPVSQDLNNVAEPTAEGSPKVAFGVN